MPATTPRDSTTWFYSRGVAEAADPGVDNEADEVGPVPQYKLCCYRYTRQVGPTAKFVPP